MYLSQLVLNRCSRAVRHDIADCHELHRTLLCAFGQAPAGSTAAREQFGLLYRIETDRRGVHVLAQSAAEPNWAHLPADYLLTLDDGRPNPAVKSIDGALGRIAPEME